MNRPRYPGGGSRPARTAAALAVAVALLAGAQGAVAAMDDPLTCLAKNIYWEARSEPEVGKRAVAFVTLNRMQSDAFPDTVCGVVRQGEELGRGRCQFHWWCDGKPNRPENAEEWARAQRIARGALDGRDEDPTDGALFFHRHDVSPNWAGAKTRTTAIGAHVFYR